MFFIVLDLMLTRDVAASHFLFLALEDIRIREKEWAKKKDSSI